MNENISEQMAEAQEILEEGIPEFLKRARDEEATFFQTSEDIGDETEEANQTVH